MDPLTFLFGFCMGRYCLGDQAQSSEQWNSNKKYYKKHTGYCYGKSETRGPGGPEGPRGPSGPRGAVDQEPYESPGPREHMNKSNDKS